MKQSEKDVAIAKTSGRISMIDKYKRLFLYHHLCEYDETADKHSIPIDCIGKILFHPVYNTIIISKIAYL